MRKRDGRNFTTSLGAVIETRRLVIKKIGGFLKTVIRKAGINDVKIISEMIAELFAIEVDFKSDRAKQDKAVKMIISGKTGGVIFIAENDSMAAGMINLQKIISTAAGGYSVLLEDLYVIPEFRKTGIGKLLIDRAIQWGREHNALRVQLAADVRNIPASDFYTGRGFEKSNMVFYYKYIEIKEP